MPGFGNNRQYFAMRANGCNPYAAGAISGFSYHRDNFTDVEFPCAVAPQPRTASVASLEPNEAFARFRARLPVGSEVCVVGLQQRPDLNGQSGKIVECEKAGRCKVQMEDNSYKMVKMENLHRMVSQVHTAQASSSSSSSSSSSLQNRVLPVGRRKERPWRMSREEELPVMMT